MKTVIDAVNEYKAQWVNGRSYIYAGSPTNLQNKGSLQITYLLVENSQWNFVCTRDEFNQCVEEMTNMNIRPVYTQAMVDAGVMPSVGMECLINFPDIDNAWYEYIIDFMGKHTFIATCEDVAERFGHVEDVHFKPLTPPIELIDGKAYQFESVINNEFCGVYDILKDTFVASQGLFFLPNTVTNIQLLEVKS